MRAPRSHPRSRTQTHAILSDASHRMHILTSFSSAACGSPRHSRFYVTASQICKLATQIVNPLPVVGTLLIAALPAALFHTKHTRQQTHIVSRDCALQAAHARLNAHTPPQDTTPKAEYIAATALTCLSAGLAASPPSTQLSNALAGNPSNEVKPLSSPLREPEGQSTLSQLPAQLLHLASTGEVSFSCDQICSVVRVCRQLRATLFAIECILAKIFFH